MLSVTWISLPVLMDNRRAYRNVETMSCVLWRTVIEFSSRLIAGVDTAAKIPRIRRTSNSSRSEKPPVSAAAGVLVSKSDFINAKNYGEHGYDDITDHDRKGQNEKRLDQGDYLFDPDPQFIFIMIRHLTADLADLS